MRDDFTRDFPPGVKLGCRLDGGDRIKHVAWSPCNLRLAAGREDGCVRVWDDLQDRFWETRAAPTPRDFRAHDSPVWHVAWSPTGSRLATVSTRREIRVWDAESIRPLASIKIDAQELYCVAWSQGETYLSAALVAGEHPHARLTIRRYELSSGNTVEERSEASWNLAYTAMSADRRLLAVATPERVVQVWDVAAARPVADVDGRYGPLYGVALAPDSKSLALCLEDGAIQIYETESGRKTCVLQEHQQPAYSVAFSDDGRLLASKSADNTVCLWRCDRWQRVGSLEEAGVGGEEVELAFQPGTTNLTSYDSKNTALRLWWLDYEQLMMGGKMISILFLAADPFDGSRLRLGEEQKEIEEKLQLAGLRSRFRLYTRTAVRPEDLSQKLLDVRPNIVHFSGHGSANGEIWLEDKTGQSHPVAPDDLAALFKLVADEVDCVILNACYSKVQAAAISRSINYVIGMNDKIGDRAAIAFTVGFYQALGAGLSVEKAFEFGCAQVRIQGIPEHSTPVLKKKRKPRSRSKPPAGP